LPLPERNFSSLAPLFCRKILKKISKPVCRYKNSLCRLLKGGFPLTRASISFGSSGNIIVETNTIPSVSDKKSSRLDSRTNCLKSLLYFVLLVVSSKSFISLSTPGRSSLSLYFLQSLFFAFC